MFSVGTGRQHKLWHGTLQIAREKHGGSIIVWYMLATPGTSLKERRTNLHSREHHYSENYETYLRL